MMMVVAVQELLMFPTGQEEEIFCAPVPGDVLSLEKKIFLTLPAPAIRVHFRQSLF